MELRSDKFKSASVLAPEGGYLKNALVCVGALVGVIVQAAAAGAATTLIYACDKIKLPKAVGAVAVGDRLYFDPDNGCLTTTQILDEAPGGYVAICTEAAGSLEAEVECDLLGGPRVDATIYSGS